MKAQYWHQKWDKDSIGFHQDKVNKRLVKFWPNLVDGLPVGSDDKTCVFVPLCGKTLDMLWLRDQGHQVIGVELSDKAARAFFDENGLACKSSVEGEFTFVHGVDKAKDITIMVGDFFKLTPAHVASCSLMYDRAAMIAMSRGLRADYANHMAMLMRPGSQGLLLAISYDQQKMDGPPFSVPDENVRDLLSSGFSIEEIAHYGGPERVGNLADKGLETLDERVYLLTRKS